MAQASGTGGTDAAAESHGGAAPSGKARRGREGKVHSSAVCIVPPSSMWGRIQRIRCFNDKSFVRWPPHVNLLYPFISDDTGAFEGAAVRAAEALRDVAPFEVHLGSFGRFDHRSTSTAWLRPDHPGVCQVQAALQGAFPFCDDLSNDPGRGISAFSPHLSVGQWRGAAADGAIRRLSESWPEGGVSFAVNEVYLISREGFRHPFGFRWAVPLGGRGPPRLLDIPYVASVAREPTPVTPPAAAPQLGPGALCPQGVWTFAYGANMSPAKLKSRGMTPLESKPARLPGHCLLFDHRGGFGNVVPATEAAAALSACRRRAAAAAAPASAEGDGGAGGGGGGGGGGVARSAGGAASATEPAAPSSSSSAAAAAAAAGGGGGGDVVSRQVAPPEVHGVLHLLAVDDYGALCNMEHEYWPLEVQAVPYYGSPPFVPCIAFSSPPERRVAPCLPPPARYLRLLQDGARHWGLDAAYAAWLRGLEGVEAEERGQEYYTATDGGARLEAWQKFRTGSSNQQRRRGGGRGRGGGGDRGGDAAGNSKVQGRRKREGSE